MIRQFLVDALALACLMVIWGGVVLLAFGFSE